jgi:hypothetical protein
MIERFHGACGGAHISCLTRVWLQAIRSFQQGSMSTVLMSMSRLGHVPTEDFMRDYMARVEEMLEAMDQVRRPLSQWLGAAHET